MTWKAIIICLCECIFLGLVPCPVFAQTSDTLLHADSLHTGQGGLHTISSPAGDTASNDTVRMHPPASGIIHIADDTTKKSEDAIPIGIGIKTMKRAHKGGYVISGKVEDMSTKEGIPSAVILFPNASLGASADLDGNFIINTDTLPNDTLHIQAMGYKAVNRILEKTRHEYSFKVDLVRTATSLNEVVVHAGEDPAILLMKKIIARKPFNNPDRMENYSYLADNRLEADMQRMSKKQFSKIPILKTYSFIFNNMDSTSDTEPFLPLYLTEALSDYYFRRDPKKQREFIKGSIIKGINNDNIIKYLGSLYQNVNIYRNYLPVFDKKFVSPISNDGLFYYNYTIKDTERAYGHNIIQVAFSPRRPGEACFTGNFWVVDSVFAIERISMNVSKLANINWVDRVNIYKEFAPVDSFWFCTEDKFVADFTIYDSKKLLGFIGRKTTTYHNIVINDTSVTNVLDNPHWKEEVIKLDSAKNRPDAWWAKNRQDTLSKTEKAIYKMTDTINSMPITTFYKHLILFLASGVQDIGPLQLGPYFYLYSSNPVEGNRFRISLGTPRKIKNVHITGFLAYGDKDNRFKYGVTGLWLLKRHPWMYLYGYYVHDIDQSTSYYDQLGSDNIFSSLFRKPGVPWKLAFSDDERFEFFKEYFSGFSHKLILQHRIYTPYAPLPAAGIFYDDNGNPSNSVTSSEVGLELRYAYKEKYIEGQYLRAYFGTKYPVVDLEVDAGIKDVLNSGYQYQKARFSVTESINIPPFGHLYYNLFAGKYFGTLPYPLLNIVPGNEYYYYNQYAFEMMNTYEFITDQYAGFNIEHNIGGGLFNHIPALKRLKWRQFWTAKGVIGSLSDANEQLNLNKGFPFRTLQGDPYLELGTGVSNIFQIFRIDFDWRVAPAPLPTEAKTSYFGIFGSVNFQF
jgi:hypothetical protein